MTRSLFTVTYVQQIDKYCNQFQSNLGKFCIITRKGDAIISMVTLFWRPVSEMECNLNGTRISYTENESRLRVTDADEIAEMVANEVLKGSEQRKVRQIHVISAFQSYSTNCKIFLRYWNQLSRLVYIVIALSDKHINVFGTCINTDIYFGLNCVKPYSLPVI